jgi:ATP-dependent Lon protease
VLQLLKLPDGTVKVLVEGTARAEITSVHRPQSTSTRPMSKCLTEPSEDKVEVEALARSVVSEFENYVKLNKKVSPEGRRCHRARSTDYSKLADTSLRILPSRFLKSRKCSATLSVKGRLEKAMGFMEAEISVLQVEKRIRSRVKRQMEKTQREYYLNEQMKAIQKELGDGEDGRDEVCRTRSASRTPSSPRKPATNVTPN